MDLKEALKSLDATNDEHWTEQGLPQMSVVKELTGKHYSRKEITDAMPLLQRARLIAGDPVEVSDDPDATKPDDTEAPKIEAKPEPEAAATPDALEGLKADLEVAEKKLAEAEAASQAAHHEFRRMTALVDKLRTDIDNLTPKVSQTNEIMRYLARQHQMRMDRVKTTLPGDKSPVDQRLANRPRPQRSPL